MRYIITQMCMMLPLVAMLNTAAGWQIDIWQQLCLAALWAASSIGAYANARGLERTLQRNYVEEQDNDNSDP